MNKFEKCAVIRHLFLKEMSGKAIHDDTLRFYIERQCPCIQCNENLASRVQTSEKVSRMSIIQDAPKMQQVPKMFKLLIIC